VCCPADCCRSRETVLESLTRVAECRVTECATRSVVSRRAWRRATVCSPDEEKGCKLEGAMSSGIRVACKVDSTVGGTFADELSAVIAGDERHKRRLYASLQWTTTLVSKQSRGQRSTVAFNQAVKKGFPIPPRTRTLARTPTATHLERCSPCTYHEQRITTRNSQKVGKQTRMVS
jgi:hypothetical protein